MENEQKSIDYGAVLADLEAKRDALDNAISVIKQQMGVLSASPSNTPHKPHGPETLKPDTFFGMNIGDAAKKYLSIVKTMKTVPEIAEALQTHGLHTVAKNFEATVFSSLRRREGIETCRPKRSKWGLIEWYPGFRPKKENGEKPEKGDAEPKPKPAANPNEPNRRARGIADNSGVITVGELEDFVAEKPRRMSEIVGHFKVAEHTVMKMLEPESKVYHETRGWYKIRQPAT